MLIVEDQELVRRLLREYLQSAYPGAQITEAADGESALGLCRECAPELVLMDIELPDANGIDLTAQIRRLLPDTPVIIVSQHSGAAYVERARQAGACAYVVKDQVHRELLPAVARTLGLACAGDQPRGRS